MICSGEEKEEIETNEKKWCFVYTFGGMKWNTRPREYEKKSSVFEKLDTKRWKKNTKIVRSEHKSTKDKPEQAKTNNRIAAYFFEWRWRKKMAWNNSNSAHKRLIETWAEDGCFTRITCNWSIESHRKFFSVFVSSVSLLPVAWTLQLYVR